MKTIKHLLLIVTLTIITLHSSGQGVVTIPTVVHVVWHDTAENIPDSWIQSQIDILNTDFRKLNVDTSEIPKPFKQYAGDAKIEFCLAQRDTSGNPTTGITRTYTAIVNYDYPLNLDSISHTSLGGENGWDPSRYFNIWVGGFTDETGTSPYQLSVNPDEDGIYINYLFFGAYGETSYAGREADYLAGEWLNIYNTAQFNIGGNCYDDSVADTPPVEGPAYGCVTFPHNPNDSCGTDSSGEMTSNFMTFSDGSCKNFFTNGQIARMHACLNTTRSSLLTSDGCTPLGINELTNNMNLKLFPNPSSGTFSITTHNLQKAKLEIYNMMGSIIYEQSLTSPQSAIDISREASGIYFVFVTDGTYTWAQKIIKE